MTSRTSCFNPALFRKNLTRFAPMWGIFLGLLLVTGPLSLITSLANGHYYTAEIAIGSRYASAEAFLNNYPNITCIFSFVYALLCGAACFEYLHKARSAYMMHAFPMTRNCHFFTNVLSGLCFALVPYFAADLLMLLIVSIYGIGSLAGQILLLLVKTTLQYFCFFGIAVFCMHLTGNTIIGILSYFAASFIGWALPALITNTIVQPLFYGFAEPAFSFTALSPVIKLMETGSTLKSAWIYVYAALGIGLLIAAWLHYRVRHMERAGDAMVYGWAKVVFLVLFTAMVGLLIALASYMILSGGISPADNTLLFTICLLIGLFVAYFGGQMMLGRTTRVFRGKHFWLGYAAFAAAAILGIVCLRTDVLGLQRKVPTAEQIEYVEMSTQNQGGYMAYTASDSDTIRISDAEGLALVTQMHKAAIDERGREPSRDYWDVEVDGQWVSFNLVYHLKNGSTMTRAYNVFSKTVYQNGKTLYSDPARAKKYYEGVIPQHFAEVSITDMEGNGYEIDRPDLLREAILADAAAGRLPIINCFTEGTDSDELEVTLWTSAKSERPIVFLINTNATQTMALLEKVEWTEPEVDAKR